MADVPGRDAYHSHDPAGVERQVVTGACCPHSPGYCELVGSGSFEDRGVPLLFAAAARQRLAVSAYYEKTAGEDATRRIKQAYARLLG